MRHSLIILLAVSMVSVIGISAAFFAQSKPAAVAVTGALPEQDEIRQTFQLAPGQRVEVSQIKGPVEIETTDSNVAEVHVVRSAQNRSDLEQYKISVENSSQSLTIRGEQTRRGSGYDGPQVRHHVTLKLPRRVDLSLQGIGGDVRVGDVNGPLAVNTVSGSLQVGAVSGQVQVIGVGKDVTIGQASQQVDIKTVSGSLKVGAVGGQVQIIGVGGGVSIGQASQQVDIKTVTGDVNIGPTADSLNVMGVGGALSASISKLGQRGVQISTVTQGVQLRFRDELNAQLSTDSIVGELSLDIPNVTVQSRPRPSAMRALIGKGGPPITIKSVAKSVSLVKGS